MNGDRLVQWEAIAADGFSDGLLLGNGASIALYRRFQYESLYKRAVASGRLSTTQPLFEAIGRGRDFEYVLFCLSHADLAARTLGGDTASIAAAYAEVRAALIDTVREVHCEHDEVEAELANVARFVKRFRTIVTFNYDLTLYWAMAHDDWSGVTDGFRNGHFDPEWHRAPASGSLVCYAHGSLMLGRRIDGEEVKLARRDLADNLLTAVSDQWASGGISPIFVGEGTSARKLAAIRRSPYLNDVYARILSGFGEKSVVVYGLSFNSNDDNDDDHILDALAKAPPSRIAISVHIDGDTSATAAFCSRVRGRIYDKIRPSPQVVFFDAASPCCWKRCAEDACS